MRPVSVVLTPAAAVARLDGWPISTRSFTARPAPFSTFTTREEAEAELAAVLRDEPDWLPDLRVVPSELIVSE